MKTIEEKPSLTLSHSSASLLRGCEQKYVYYKVLGIDKDDDSEQNEEAFNVGKATHYIIEQLLHSYTNFSEFENHLDYAAVQFQIQHKRELVAALAFKLLQLHKREKLHTVHCEFKIETEVVLGYVDLIACDDDKNWWIIDIKTASRLDNLTVAKLHNDYQLNLYAYHYKLIAKGLNLDPKKFMGCRYRVVTKSAAKLKTNETIPEYIKRTQNTIKGYEIIIPKEKMNPDLVFKEHKSLQRRARALHKGSKPKCNYAHCSSFFRPCEYWSKCHGDTFTNSASEFEINEY